MNKLWGEVNKIAGDNAAPISKSEIVQATDKQSSLSSKQQALANLDGAAHQLELQRSALADTASGVKETIDLLTRSGTVAAMGSADPALKATIDHVEKSAAVMAERAEVTKAAQKKAASALFTQILQTI